MARIPFCAHTHPRKAMTSPGEIGLVTPGSKAPTSDSHVAKLSQQSAITTSSPNTAQAHIVSEHASMPASATASTKESWPRDKNNVTSDSKSVSTSDRNSREDTSSAPPAVAVEIPSGNKPPAPPIKARRINACTSSVTDERNEQQQRQPEPKRRKTTADEQESHKDAPNRLAVSSTSGHRNVSSTNELLLTTLMSCDATASESSTAAAESYAAQMSSPTVHSTAALPRRSHVLDQGMLQQHSYNLDGTTQSRSRSMYTAASHPYPYQLQMMNLHQALPQNTPAAAYPPAEGINQLMQQQQQQRYGTCIHQGLQQSYAEFNNGLACQGYNNIMPRPEEYYQRQLDAIAAKRALLRDMMQSDRQREHRQLLEMGIPSPPAALRQFPLTSPSDRLGDLTTMAYSSNAAREIRCHREEIMMQRQQDSLLQQHPQWQQQYSHHYQQQPLRQVAVAEHDFAFNQFMSSMRSTQGEMRLDPVGFLIPSPAPPQAPFADEPLPQLHETSKPEECTRADGLSSIPSGVPIYTSRKVLSLATPNDDERLSEYLCFIRKRCVEVFEASFQDVQTRNVSRGVIVGQCGLRCRFCAHLNLRDRECRSSSFPSSLSRIYQSITMMLRDHFSNCDEMPEDIRRQFFALKATTAAGGGSSKQYWIDSAMRIGMYDAGGRIMLLRRP